MLPLCLIINFGSKEVNSIPDIRVVVLYEHGYDYTKSKYGDKAKLCYIYTDTFIVHIKYEDLYADLAEDAETRIERPLFIKKKCLMKKLMKDELGWRIMKGFEAVRPKIYSYLTDDGCIEKCVEKWLHCFENNERVLKTQ